jgi:hypothetical protein
MRSFSCNSIFNFLPIKPVALHTAPERSYVGGLIMSCLVDNGEVSER